MRGQQIQADSGLRDHQRQGLSTSHRPVPRTVRWRRNRGKRADGTTEFLGLDIRLPTPSPGFLAPLLFLLTLLFLGRYERTVELLVVFDLPYVLLKVGDCLLQTFHLQFG
jgi:hypothetical protein